MKGIKLSPQAIAAQLALRKVPSPFGHPSYGRGGRQSNAGITAAVFGNTGFIGKYIMGELGTRGCKVYAPYRGCELEGRHLKTSFDLGNLGQMEFSPRDEDSIRSSIRDADVVINLVGKYYETKHVVKTRRADGTLSNINYGFDEVHVEIPRRIARIAKEQGVTAMIHMSALCASADSASAFSRSKAAGEKAVREEFPEAIIVKPANIFGHEDLFLNWFAEMAALYPIIPLVNNGENICQPVFGADVGRALMALVYNHADFAGSNVHLAGPEEYSYRELVEYVLEVTNLQERRTLVGAPHAAIELFCKINQLGMNPTFTEDNLKQMLENNTLATAAQTPGVPVYTFADLGVTPTDMAKVSYDFLHRFRSGGHFREIQGYH